MWCSSIETKVAAATLFGKCGIPAKQEAPLISDRHEPKFLAIEASEAIALKHPRYESEEIPPSVFNAKPAWPDDKVETVSVSYLIVARKALSETTVAAFFRQLFAVRQAIARQVPGAAHITKPDTEKDAKLPVHRGAALTVVSPKSKLTKGHQETEGDMGRTEILRGR